MTANRPIDVAGAEHLLEGFMANRKARTLQAYWADLNAFAGFVGQAPAQAIAQLLGGGGEAAARRVLEFAVDRRSQGFAAATVQRRLATLRALTRFALNQSVLEWSLEPPDNEQLEEAVRARSASTVPYLFPRHPGEID